MRQVPRQRRPSAWWFVPGGVLLLLAPLLFVGGLVWTLRPLLTSDGHFPTDAGLHEMHLPAHTQRALFVRRGEVAPDCGIADSTGHEIEPRGVSGGYETTFDGVGYRAYLQFDTGDGSVVVTCVSAGFPSRVYVAAVPTTAALVRGVLISVLGPIGLGLAGMTVVVVVAFLRSRRPRPGP